MKDARCTLCGEPMPAGEEMFKFHGYSGDCPKPPLQTPGWDAHFDECARRFDVLCKAVPQCKCGTFQVQVIKTSPPAVWKCRICKTIWEFEPEPSNGE